jgi:predicted metalloprotease
MRWESGRRSSNVEDRRGSSRGRKTFAGGGLGLIAVVVLGLVFGVDPMMLIQGVNKVAPPSANTKPGPRPAAENQLADFVTVVLADTEDTWHAIFKSAGKRYQEPTLVMFTGATESACGHAQSAMGPFYCPADQKLYIDLQFYQDMRTRFGAPGDFAQAYVIAHEVGHHVQTLLGISDQVARAQRRASKTEANQLQVRMELQADCFAGIWANHADRARHILEQGDVAEGLNAAAAIGDDRLQKQAQGYVVPESFTHGSSEQRVRWFKRGLETGALQQCDTFAAKRL